MYGEYFDTDVTIWDTRTFIDEDGDEVEEEYEHMFNVQGRYYKGSSAWYNKRNECVEPPEPEEIEVEEIYDYNTEQNVTTSLDDEILEKIEQKIWDEIMKGDI